MFVRSRHGALPGPRRLAARCVRACVCVYIYIYIFTHMCICMYVCMYVYIYIYIDIERERERERYVCTYIHRYGGFYFVRVMTLYSELLFLNVIRF